MRPLEPTLIELAQAREVRTQFAFAFRLRGLPDFVWRYSSPTALTLYGDVYAAAVIGLKDAREGSDGKTEAQQFTLELAPVEPFLSFVGRSLPFLLEVDVHECYFDDAGAPWPDSFTAQLCDCQIVAGKVTATFQRLAAWAELKFPRDLVQLTDGRTPWGDVAEWGLDPQAAAVRGTVLALDRNVCYCAAASAQPAGYYDNAWLSYERTLGGRVVTLRHRVVTNVPTPDAAQPALGYLLLSQPAPLLDEEDAEFWLYPGYAATRAASRALNNFHTRVLQTVQQITGLTSLAAIQLNHAYPLFDKGFTSATFPSAATFDAVAGTITFTVRPDSLLDAADLRWAGRGYRGFPELPADNPALTSQAASTAPAGPQNLPTIGGYENALGDAITKVAAGQTFKIKAAVVEGAQSNFGSPAAVSPVRINGADVTLEATYGGGYRWQPQSGWPANATAITLTLPPVTPGNVLIELVNANGLEGTNDPTPVLAAAAAPFLDSVKNPLGATITATAVGLKVRLVGAGFGAQPSRYATDRRQVLIGTLELKVTGTYYNKVDPFLVWNDNQIEFLVPAAGSYPYTGAITITKLDGTVITTGLSLTLTGTAADLADHFANADATRRRVTSTVAGAELWLVGFGFGSTRGTGFVKFNGVAAAAYLVWGDTAIRVKVPALTAYGATPVTVTLQTNAGLTDTAPALIVGKAAGLPWLDHVASTTAEIVHAAYQDATLRLVGENFGASRGTGTVRLGNVVLPAAAYRSWTARLIEVKLDPTYLFDLGVAHPVVVTRADNAVASSADAGSPAGTLMVQNV